MKINDRVYQDISRRRAYQDAQFGGPGNDDRNTPGAWAYFIAEYALGYNRSKDKTFRERMVDVAALAVAAIESHDRREGCSLNEAGGGE